MRGDRLAPSKSCLYLMSLQTDAQCSPAATIRALKRHMDYYTRHLVLPTISKASSATPTGRGNGGALDVRNANGLGPPVTKRYTRLLLVAVVWLVFVGSLSLRAHTAKPTEPISAPNNETTGEDTPPTYQEYIDYERNLP